VSSVKPRPRGRAERSTRVAFWSDPLEPNLGCSTLVRTIGERTCGWTSFSEEQSTNGDILGAHRDNSSTTVHGHAHRRPTLWAGGSRRETGDERMAARRVCRTRLADTWTCNHRPRKNRNRFRFPSSHRPSCQRTQQDVESFKHVVCIARLQRRTAASGPSRVASCLILTAYSRTEYVPPTCTAAA
jgi:hypothetical protein